MADHIKYALSVDMVDEFTTTDVEKGNIEIIAKASGEKVTYSDDIEVIPNYSRALRDAADKIDEDILDRTFSQRIIKAKNVRRKTKIKP